MENNLYLNFEDKTKEIAEKKEPQKKEGKNFYDKVLEERSRLETTDAAIATIAKSKLQLNKTSDELPEQENAKKYFGNKEVLNAATKYFDGDELAAKVWMNKYALKDSEGKFYELTPADMHKRIAREIARIEKKYTNPMSESEILEVLKDFKYIIPAGSPMAGIGNDNQISSLSNCFVIGNEGNSDSYGGILKIDQEQVQLMKRRGGEIGRAHV